MSSSLRQCPHCGAYILGEHDVCPRCDQPLADAPDPVTITRPDGDAATLPDVPHRAAPFDPDDENTLSDVHAPSDPEAEAPGAPAASPEDAPDRSPAESADQPPGDERLKPSPAEPSAEPTSEPIDKPADKPDIAPPPAAPPVTEATQPRLPQAAPAEDTIPNLVIAVDDEAPYRLPPAPYTAPPEPVAPPGVIEPPQDASNPYLSYQPGYAAPSYAWDQASAYLQQRIQLYHDGGYRLVTHGPHEASLERGKNLGFFGWLLALVSLIGFVWYLLILLVSGFRRDPVYLTLEADGRVYEDGAGAAHVRQARSRAGRRWALVGLVLTVLCLIGAAILAGIGGAVLTNDRYRAALREAYPELLIFEDELGDTAADADDVALMEDGAVAFSIVGALVLVGLWGGLTLLVIGIVHARAYRVQVPPLPGYA